MEWRKREEGEEVDGAKQVWERAFRGFSCTIESKFNSTKGKGITF